MLGVIPVRHQEITLQRNLSDEQRYCLRPNLHTSPKVYYPIRASTTKQVLHFSLRALWPPKEVGNNGDLYILQKSSEPVLYWKKKMSDGRCTWLEVGGNGLSIQHPIHKELILRGGTCHLYPHWCMEDGFSNDDDLYNAARRFLGDFESGSSLKPVDLTFG